MAAGVFGVALLIALLVYWGGSDRPAPETVVEEQSRPSPVPPGQPEQTKPVARRPSAMPRLAPEQQQPPPPASPQPPVDAPVASAGSWAVIAATYNNYGAAAKRAAQLARASSDISPRVLPPEGQGRRYYVVLGLADSRREAERLLERARAAGMPRDAYVTRVEF
jgi:cell division protein FtsN